MRKRQKVQEGALEKVDWAGSRKTPSGHTGRSGQQDPTGQSLTSRLAF